MGHIRVTRTQPFTIGIQGFPARSNWFHTEEMEQNELQKTPCKTISLLEAPPPPSRAPTLVTAVRR